MLSTLITVILKFSPLLAHALETPISGMLVHVLAHHFGYDANDIEGLTGAIVKSSNTKELLESIVNEHGEVLKMFSGTKPVGSQPPMMEMTIVQKFYYGDQPHGSESQGFESKSEN